MKSEAVPAEQAFWPAFRRRSWLNLYRQRVEKPAYKGEVGSISGMVYAPKPLRLQLSALICLPADKTPFVNYMIMC